MRNLVILKDTVLEYCYHLTPVVSLCKETRVVDICPNVDNEEILVLTNHGTLIAHSLVSPNGYLASEPWCLNSAGEDGDHSWFSVAALYESGSIVCVSHSGNIVSLQTDKASHSRPIPESEGCVDDGIADAAWSPDQTCIAIISNNCSILLMTNTFDVINEVPMEARQPGSACCISWRGDGLQFALYSVDANDGVARVRLFDRDLVLLAEGKTAAEGAGAVVRNLLPSLAYAPNGSVVASVQQRTPKKQQIVFFERSGLRHGEFDLQNPFFDLGACVDGDYSKKGFAVIGLAFNIESTVLAVTLRGAGSEPGAESSSMQFVQLYHRNNYHWYLKQQWSGNTFSCHGFDAELPDRLYLSEVSPTGLRAHVVDLVWDTCSSISADCTVAVVDGREILLTPLGRALVPPPMSMHRLQLPAPSRHVSFWRSGPLAKVDDSSELSALPWGLACLCDGDIIRLWMGGDEDIDASRGNAFKPSVNEDLILSEIAGASGIVDFSAYTMRAVQVTCSSAITDCTGRPSAALCVVCVAGRTRRITDMSEGGSAGDDIILIRQCIIGMEWVWRMEVYPIHATGSVLRMIPWADDYDCVGIGLSTGQGVISGFEVVKMSISQGHVDFHTEFLFAENCARKLEVVGWNRTEAGTGANRKYLCLGLSSAPHTSRLYCGDNLLSASHVSSFTTNATLGVMLFVTATSKPLLQFVSLNALHGIVQDIDGNLLTAETAEQPRFLFAEPRPVERGTRVVSSPLGSSSVVMQMPRGNLEGCDPRPLVLIRSRILLQQLKYIECLLLLRRQRVDLNLLVDHDPHKFLSQVPSLVAGAASTNSELLSLLVSALENGNVCAQKYFLPDMNITSNQVMALPQSAGLGDAISAPKPTFDWDNKVNVVCESISSALFASIANHAAGDISGALLPLLCSCAKQRPPQLARALYVVKRYALNMDIAESDETSETHANISRTDISNAMSSSKAQKCIKYIAFLCDYKDLFEAALGECDFDMARAVARQGGQMDPKVYLPMLQKLQSSGGVDMYSAFSGYVQTTTRHASLESCPLRASSNYCLMRFRVFSHLKRYELSVLWALQCFEVLTLGLIAEESTDSGVPKVDATELVRDIVATAGANKLHKICFPRLRALRQRVLGLVHDAAAAVTASSSRPILQVRSRKKSVSTNHPAVAMVTSLLSKIYHSYGGECHSQGNFKEAVSAYLASAEPDVAKLAVNSAIQSGDWQLALGVAGRFFDPNAQVDDSGEEENPFFAGQTVGSLDPRVIAQGLIDDYRSTVEQGFGGEDTGSELVTAFQHHSIKEVDDADGMGARVTDDRAMEAAQLCMEYFDDVEGAVSILLLSKRWMQAAELASRKRRQDLLREEVGGAAKSEASRMIRLLVERQDRHIELVNKLNALWEDAPGRLTAVSGVDPTLLAAIRGAEKVDDLEESRSDFGGGTSVYSDMSLASNLSDASAASSTLSMLSNLSLSTELRGLKSGPQSESFSIDGIEHNLLSRGKANKTEFSSYQENKKKKRQRKGKGEYHGGKDVFGLKQEGAMTRDLYALGDVSAVACAVCEVCDVLLLVGGFDLQTLACELQHAMDQYIEAISATVAPQAPLYPQEWLDKRNMDVVRWFQNSPENCNPGNIIAKHVWWRKAVAGITTWKNIRKACLHIVVE